MSVEQAQFVGRNEHKAGFVESTAACATEHLQQFVRFEELFRFVAAIGFAGERDAAQRKVDAGR